MNLFSEPTFEQVTLERLRISVDNYVSRHAVLEASEDYLTNSLRYSLRSEVLAQKLGTKSITKTVDFEEPASTWQMFKRQHATSWWLRWLVERRPVRTTTHVKSVTVQQEASYIYPDARIALPEDRFGAPFLVHRMVTR